MPRKRRIAKSRELSDGCLEDQFYGPGTCLFNGDGYLAAHGDGMWNDKSPEVQSAILAAMRLDWEAHWPRITKAWAERGEHELWCAERHHGNPAHPWAQTEFGGKFDG